MNIACLHTAEVHIATFSALFEAFPGVSVRHVVRSDLLDRARQDGTEAVRADTLLALEEIAVADAVLCTCSTLGPLVSEPFIRIDRPAMQAAADLGEDIVVAICLESTRDATLSLLSDFSGGAVTPRLVLCENAWPYFEAGDQDAFATSIAATIRAEVEAEGRPDGILLAQASMRLAAPLLDGLAPVITTPERAVQATIEAARG